MRAYLVPLALGDAVGAAHGLRGVHSPAPPLAARAGLLGMPVGGPLAAHLRARW